MRLFVQYLKTMFNISKDDLFCFIYGNHFDEKKKRNFKLTNFSDVYEVGICD